MANIVLMPQLGISEESAVLSSWAVKAGDRVRAGEKLFTLETGKAGFDVESEFEGTVLELLCEEGDELPIQAPLCVIGEPGESYTVAKKAGESAPEEKKPEATAKPQAAPVAAQPEEGGRLKASPRAKSLASKAGVALEGIAPSGPEGRIIERDVSAALDSGAAREAVVSAAPTAPAVPEAAPASAAAEYEDVKLSRVRKLTAENMRASLASTAQLTLNASFDASELLAFRAKLKAAPGLEGITINDMAHFAVSRTLGDFPEINAHFLGDKIRRFSSVALGFACDTEKGLLVPVIRGAEKLSLLEMSAEAKRLASACAAGALSPAEMQGGTFTVTNLGALGVESFTPVLNPPQVCILGVCAPVDRVRSGAQGLEAYKAVTLSLTFDHQAVDGAPAARFLRALCKNLENFQLLTVK